MSSSDSPGPSASARPTSEFATTHWSLVLRAAGQREDPQVDRALASLCQRYWLPLYVFARRRVADAHEAQDLTQAFFARLLEQNGLASASPERGRFRSFLLASMKNFLANEWDRARAKKRGGGRGHLSLDWEAGESQLGLEPSHNLTPERLFDRQWTLTLLEHVISRLRAEFVTAGKEEQFDLLKGALVGDRSQPYLEIAGALQMTDTAARQAAHRLRKRYRELLQDEVAQTVAKPDDVDEEIRRLFETLQP
jgi:RNA polymerase sigma factor (sigma-70 family)